MINFIASVFAMLVMLGIAALLTTPYGLMALPFILAVLLGLWIIRRTWRRIRNRAIVWRMQQTPEGRRQIAAILRIVQGSDVPSEQPR